MLADAQKVARQRRVCDRQNHLPGSTAEPHREETGRGEPPGEKSKGRSACRSRGRRRKRSSGKGVLGASKKNEADAGRSGALVAAKESEPPRPEVPPKDRNGKNLQTRAPGEHSKCVPVPSQREESASKTGEVVPDDT